MIEHNVTLIPMDFRKDYIKDYGQGRVQTSSKTINSSIIYTYTAYKHPKIY